MSLVYKIQQSLMEQQIYKLSDFSANYKRVDKDKKKQALKSLQFILELNKAVGFDQILLRQGFQNYSNKDQIINKRKEENCLQFFQYLKQNLDKIQSNYLRDTNDLKLIEQAQTSNQNEYNFLLNKNSVSKFIRDEASHYQKILDKYLQTIEQGEQQQGVKSKNMHSFLIDFFTNKCTAVLKDHKTYLARPAAQIQVQIGNHLYEYGKKAKELTEEQAKHQYFIAEQQMLDFLTFWLKQESNIFILYARTQQRLNKQSKFITNQSHLTTAVHPSRMTAEEIVKKEQEIQLVKQQQLAKSHVQKEENTKKQESKIQQSHKQKNIQYKTLILKGQRSENTQIQRNNSQELQGGTKRQLSKEDLLSRQMKTIFEFGCKRRYKLNKNTTFQDIQLESKTMTFQKFFNFCTFFELTSILTKELITQYFRMNDLNLRILDYQRFQNVINKMVKADKRVAQNLLKKLKFQINHKKNQIKSSKKSQQQLSGYKFILHPINGKDVSTIEKELSYRKLEKMIVRQQKQRKGYIKREKIEKQESKITKKSIPTYSLKKISHAELQPIRDITFNPQKLISNNENDKLWDAYQAKIWNRDQSSQSALQSILTKRIQRGNIVINKLHSQRSFIYDQ